MNQLLQQTESQWSATGGPRVPTTVHPLVKNIYTGLTTEIDMNKFYKYPKKRVE